MLRALDHIVLICADIDAGAEAYEAILGMPPSWRTVDPDDGTASVEFQVENTTLELLAPSGDGPVGDRLRELLETHGEGLMSLAYATDDIAETHHVLTRRGLGPDDISKGESTHVETGAIRRWSRFRCEDEQTSGVKTFVIQREGDLSPQPSADDSSVYALDHLVIGTPNPDRAAALYGARLGIRMALDRTAPQWNTRFLFFRIGNLTLEVVSRLDDETPADQPDRFMGITWRVRDLDAAHARLTASGHDISELRTGRKPGTRVFTIRDRTLGVPTLFLEQEPR